MSKFLKFIKSFLLDYLLIGHPENKNTTYEL